MTIREDVLKYVRKHPNQSATQIGKGIFVMSASVSSTLKLLTDEGLLERTAGGGPRKGFIYRTAKKKKTPKINKTAWELLIEGDL